MITLSFIYLHWLGPADSSDDFVPLMKATVSFNYNASGLRHILNRDMAPVLMAMTTGAGPQFPAAGFNDVTQLFEWLRDKFVSLYNDDTTLAGMLDPAYEQWELRPIDEGNGASLSQQFEIVMLCKAAPQHHHHHHHPSPVLSSASDELYSDTSSDTASNAGSAVEVPTTDAFLNSVYAFVRMHIKQLPWLREGFAAFAMSTLDGVMQDVVVQVQDIRSGTDLPKGRLFF
jgi:hypothetical protein